ncbi:phage tail sheath protein fi [hydrocarbon metagenome]|uniref:Phage tail sheath protein fi n=1 Tax=hydrocarbon metagenome TaxID=938273 RepID=A0A0W8FIL4_9ZZZZ|nr:phage tail sheath subtilisin-like domain-containing protein [Methanomicrobiaceae archaeon]
MPITPTYPGVYIEEIPSGVRTVTGVATSITAFVGRTPRGPENDPIPVFSYADFERRFGGLHIDFPMTYAIRDFYLNGGSQALVVRMVNGGAEASIAVGGLNLKAADSGAWGNNLYAAIDYEGIDADVAERFNVSDPTGLFNLTVAEIVNKEISRIEQFKNLVWESASPSPRRVDRVLEAESALVKVDADDLPESRPAQSAESTTFPTAMTSTGKKVAMTGATADSGRDSNDLSASDYTGHEANKKGIYALEKADLFNLLCIPPDKRDGDTPDTVYQAAMRYCAMRRAMLIVDPKAAWSKPREKAAENARDGLTTLGLSGKAARNAALFFPRVIQADPNRDGQLDTFAPCGMIAGIFARTDTARGVWKAPAGLDATLQGAQGLEVSVSDPEIGMLNPLGINCLRSFSNQGRVVWGARTLRGGDRFADEYKYIPVRRTALFIEESLFRGMQWVVFEPNDEPLWAQIRLNAGAFMHSLFRQGAFAGSKPGDAYFVKCDRETTTQTDINRGIVNIVVGFAPLKPAEFVIIKIQQMAGQIQT